MALKLDPLQKVWDVMTGWDIMTLTEDGRVEVIEWGDERGCIGKMATITYPRDDLGDPCEKPEKK